MIKIVEGIAEDIEKIAKELESESYELDSLQFTFRKRVYTGPNTVSDDDHNFYVAVFKPIKMLGFR